MNTPRRSTVTTDPFSDRKGLFLIAVTPPSGASGFYLVPGNSDADWRSMLSLKHMKGEVVAFNGDLQFRGNNIRRIEDAMLHEAELKKQGFKMVSYPTPSELKVVPAERPAISLDLKQATQLLAICSGPALYYNERLNKSGREVTQLSEAQIDEVLRDFGYIAPPEFLIAIAEGKVPNLPNDSTKPLQEATRDFVMQLAALPENLRSGLVSNADLIALYENHPSSPAGVKRPSRPDAPSPSLKPSPNRPRY